MNIKSAFNLTREGIQTRGTCICGNGCAGFSASICGNCQGQCMGCSGCGSFSCARQANN